MAKKKKRSFISKCIAGLKRSSDIAASSARNTCKALAKARTTKRRRKRG